MVLEEMREKGGFWMSGAAARTGNKKKKKKGRLYKWQGRGVFKKWGNNN